MPEESKKSYFFIIISMIAALAGILFGYDTGVISGAILFINNEFSLTPQINALVVSAVLFGAVIGALFSGRITDRFGRKRLLIVLSVIFIVGNLLTAISTTITQLVLGRIIVGIAIGIASYTAPLYISEIAPPKHRGALVSLNQLAISIGILLSYIVDYSLASGGLWRWMLGLGAVPAFFLLIGMVILPYSPRWMVTRERIEHTLEILERIRVGHTKEQIHAELQDIRKSLAVQKRGWRTLFTKNIRPAFLVAIGLAVIQQFIGINTILYYAPTILTMTNYQGAKGAILAALPIGLIFVVFTVISFPLIDRVGRRPLLITGLIGMGIGLLVLAWIFSQPARTHFLQEMAVGGMLLYVACFAFSLGPIMWLMITEVFPLSVRGWGSSLATATNWISNMIVTFTFLSLVKWLSASGAFLIYFGFTVISLFFVYYIVPETKNITLEKIEENLYAGKSARHIGA